MTALDGQQTIYDQLNPGPPHGSLFSGYGGIDLALEECSALAQCGCPTSTQGPARSSTAASRKRRTWATSPRSRGKTCRVWTSSQVVHPAKTSPRPVVAQA